MIANKKGVSRTLFSATKRWFGTSKPGAQSPGVAPPPTSVIYSHDSQELQLRRLGDLCFMFGLYNLAFQAYHSAKREFGADNAWLYYAGGLEMASLSAYLANIETRKAVEYLEESISCYLNHCKMPQFATRATLLSFEFLKDIGSYSEAARQLVRMTSEDSDLRSGLLLEQAAYCYLYASRSMARKYAFHLVLAGHRYSKAKQRRHSLRCYRQAYQIYENSGWSAATDHIHLTIGKHTASLQQLEESVHSMAKLLGPSKQPPVQQEMFLRDYILTLQQLNKTSPHLDLVLPIPQVNQQSIQVLLGTPIDPEKPLGTPASGISFHESRTSIARWHKLEEQILSLVNNNVTLVFKPLVCLFSSNNSSNLPVAVVGEKICVNVELWNPMNIPINIQDLTLEVKSSDVTVEPLPLTSLTLAPDSKTEVILSTVPRSSGQVHIEGVCYQLCSSNREDLICIPGTQKFSPSPSPLAVQVIESAPCLQIYFRNVQSTVLSQELQELRLVLKNLGSNPIRRIFLASPTPALFCLSSSAPCSPHVTEVPLPTALAPGSSYILPLWLQAPPEIGPASVELLFYYDSDNVGDTKSKLRYRLLRHTFHLTVLSSLHCSVLASRSCASSQFTPTVNLRLQVKNTSSPQDNNPVSTVIHLDHISLSSSNWKLKPSSLPHDKISLHKQEVSHSLIQAEALTPATDPNVSTNSTDTISDIDLSGGRGGPSLSQTPYHNFLLKSSTGMKVEGEDGSNYGEGALITGTTAFKGKLVVRWKASVTDKAGHTREAQGQHILSLERLDEAVAFPFIPALNPLPASPVRFFGARPNRNNEVKPGESNVLRRQLARYFLRYTQRVSHDFSQNKLAVVPIEARIENMSSSKLELKFKTNIDKPSIRSQLYTPHCLHSFRLLGCTLSQFCLLPGQTHSIPISAVFTRPGTYDLQSRILLSATAAEDSKDFVPQDNRTDAILILSQTEEVGNNS
ncbi:hypothetical protein M8J75_014759 [Diaphorina citri]|nr:hypothetical protein M8J75_014759 [Diaphorina citri]